MPIIVDPFLIALPIADSVDAERVRAFAQSLAEWEKEFIANTEEYVVPLSAMNVIQQAGLMPTIPFLQHLFDRCGIEEYSPRDIVPDCSSYLANCRYLEDLLEADDLYRTLEHIQGSESVIPEEMRDRLHPAVADAFIESLIYAACVLEARETAHGWSIATAPLHATDPDADLLTAATVRRITDDAAEIVNMKVERAWPLLIAPDFLYATYKVSKYLDDPIMATRIMWCRQKAYWGASSTPDWSSVRFGRRFVDSLTDGKIRRRSTFQQDIEEVFSSVLAVLQGLPYGSDKHHALRDPIWSRNAPVQTRSVRMSGGTLAYDEAARVEVTTGPAPLRLHYWRCHDGSYEFSNITSDHDAPTIYA